MNITQVKIFPVHEDKLKAFVSLVFDHDFMINDIKVIQGRDGLFLSMPSRRKKNGEFKDVAHPLNNKTRRQLEETVLEAYRQMVDDPTPRRPDRQHEDPPRAAPPPRQADQQRVEPPAAAAPPKRSDPSDEGGAPTTPMAVPEISAPPQAAPDAATAAEPAKPPGEQTLEEVREKHLSDSFWSVS